MAYIPERETVIGWEGLWQRVWENAVKQDLFYAKKNINKMAFARAYNLYKSKVNEPLEPIDERFSNFKRDINRFINLKIEPLEDRIRYLVWQEMQVWPDNKYLKNHDEEYKELYEELKIDTIEFAIERMEKRWMKI